MTKINQKLKDKLGLIDPPEEIVEKFKSVYSMCSIQERMALYSLAKDYHQKGNIYELGIARGGTSFALGLSKKEIHVFDAWGKEGSRHSEAPARLSLAPLKNVHIHKMNFYDKEYVDFVDNNGPVEIVHLDAPKGPMSLLTAVKPLLKQVIPGRTVWIFQDFPLFHFYHLNIFISLLRKFGRIVGGVPRAVLYFQFDKMPDDSVFKYMNLPLEETIEHIKSMYTELGIYHAEIMKDRIELYCHGACASACLDYKQQHQAREYILNLQEINTDDFMPKYVKVLLKREKRLSKDG